LQAPALQIENLHKSFDKPAVNGLSMTIEAGEIFALLGPNGAGKTTTMRMVAGLTRPDSGRISICGMDTAEQPIEAKRVLAWVPDEPLIYDKLTPVEYLRFIAGLWSMPTGVAETRANNLLADFGLADHAHQRCQGFSKGMRQKLALAGALIHEPRLIILDEPLTGLDAGSARQVKAVLRELVATGVTVIMTTHILAVAERMADRIGVIANGRLVAQGSLGELQSRAGRNGQTLEDVFLGIVRAAEDQTVERERSMPADAALTPAEPGRAA